MPFSDDNLQFIDVRGWAGQAIKINRDFYINLIRNQLNITDFEEVRKEILLRTENVDGVYILIGEDLEESNPLIEGVTYIGSTGNFKQRMKNYFGIDEVGKKDFCSSIVFFSLRKKLGGAGLGESLRKAIEAEIIQTAKKVKRYKVINTQEQYNTSINLSDRDILKDFVNNVKIILENRGITLLKERISIPVEDTKNYFICTEKSSNATMYRADTGYVVLKNSIIIRDNIDAVLKYYKKISVMKEKLIQTGILKPHKETGHLILMENQEFTSPSGAAAFVSGGYYSGNRVWKKKDKNEITLGDFLQSNVEDLN